MTIKEARKILGKDGEELTDDEVLGFVNTSGLLSDIFFEMLNKMCLEERNKFKKSSSKSP